MLLTCNSWITKEAEHVMIITLGIEGVISHLNFKSLGNAPGK